MKIAFVKSAIAAVIFVTSANEAVQAKDWVEKVRLSNGIDTTQISVKANSQKYTKFSQGSHRFKLDMYAKAKSGKRILGIRFASGGGIDFTESSGSAFSYKYPRSFLGGGTKRAWSHSTKPRIKLNQVRWKGHNPINACNALLNSKIKQGQSKASVLGKTHTTTATAVFHLNAVAAKPKFATTSGVTPSNKNRSQWTQERRGLHYKVRVRCLPKAGAGNQLQSG